MGRDVDPGAPVGRTSALVVGHLAHRVGVEAVGADALVLFLDVLRLVHNPLAPGGFNVSLERYIIAEAVFNGFNYKLSPKETILLPQTQKGFRFAWFQKMFLVFDTVSKRCFWFG